MNFMPFMVKLPGLATLLALATALAACVSSPADEYTTRTGVSRAQFESSLPSGTTRTVTAFGGQVIHTNYKVVQVEQYTLPDGRQVEVGYFITPDPAVSQHLGSGEPIPPKPTDEVLAK